MAREWGYWRYPDVEVLMVKSLKQLFKDVNLTGVRVATKKLREVDPALNAEVILRCDGGPAFNGVKDEGITVYVWVYSEDENVGYAYANTLALQVASLLEVVPKYAGGAVKSVEQGLVSPVEDEGATQVRSISTTAYVLGQYTTI